MMDQMKAAIEEGSADRVRELIAIDPGLADADVEWGPNGKNKVPPLHYVCDVVFRKLASQADALAMANVLIAAGAELHTVFPKTGDTLLISAASLGVEGVGLRLVECGVDIHALGIFDASALHWCALMGLPKLAKALIDAGARTDLPDAQYGSTPMGWATHAWESGTNGHREGIPLVVELLGGDPADLADVPPKDSMPSGE